MIDKGTHTMLIWEEPNIASTGYSLHIYNGLYNIHYVYTGGETYSVLEYSRNKVTTCKLDTGRVIRTVKKPIMTAPDFMSNVNSPKVCIKRVNAPIREFNRLTCNSKDVRSIFKELKEREL